MFIVILRWLDLDDYLRPAKMLAKGSHRFFLNSIYNHTTLSQNSESFPRSEFFFYINTLRNKTLPLCCMLIFCICVQY